MRKGDMEVLFSSNKMDWETPQSFYDKLNEAYKFNLDPCASAENAKCERYFTELDNGLRKDWSEGASAQNPVSVFVNPPYGSLIKNWVKKSYEEGLKEYTRVVLLIPARTDTAYWHDYCMKANQVYFVKGRLKFGGAKTGAPFPSVVVVFDGGRQVLSEENGGEGKIVNKEACLCFSLKR